MRSCLWIVLASVLFAGCGPGMLKKQYEYEEELYLALDGTATLNINASVPALVALRGIDLDVNPRARLDRDRVRAFFQGPGAALTAMSVSRRYGRRFVHVTLAVDDVRSLQRFAPVSWSTYRFDREGEVYDFKQTVGTPVGKPVSGINWDGTELVAFRLHVPSKVPFHNAPSRRVQRGNIVEWEQPLAERLRGVPIDIQVQMETQSILARTLLLFGATVLAALGTLAAVIWWVARRGRDSEIADSRA